MTLPAQHFSVSIQRSADDVYAFVSNPLNLPQWALGKVTLKFAEPNMFGVADHAVTLASGQTFQNPMRAIPNGDGCELMFTLFRQPEMSDADYEKDAETILKDLLKVKEILEQ
jgi:hypothetical protein